ncbi:relaxase/mobilization nuclease domain-containing protein [Pelagibius sp. Alg239-R121]|uniref:relaxase/mobilization nuclease domain-containing protein n=1 Tax=Pelagibius sp. Alg239-R121 TaxID=2993448 RepID=UPI0024A69D76|nr:relaxase/mobilization nuclease domain-containing protein [Pelagibius sp. Alg239-R121]
MILKGSQRGSALKLAAHLLRLDENDHVEVHELRGLSSRDLRGALQEADAVAKGTRCRQFLFSLSLNPPETEDVPVEAFEDAIETIEQRLKLNGQPRAIVFHEKEGRRHAHVVWSRINVESMTAITLPYFKMKLQVVSRELFLEHGWRLPKGLRDRTKRNPLNFTQAEWQQAKRTKQDPRALKLTFMDCWAVSDSRAAFAHAIEEQGFVLARGDRRTFVAVDWRGEVYPVARLTGERTSAVKAKLGDPDGLKSVAQARETITGRMTDKLKELIRSVEAQAESTSKAIQQKKAVLRTDQRAKRQALKEKLAARADMEAQARASRFRKGVLGLWDWISGKTRKIRKQNEMEAQNAAKRDVLEREKLIKGQLSERRTLQQDLRTMRREATKQLDDLRKDVSFYLGLRKQQPDGGGKHKRKRKSRTLTNNPSLESP